MPQIAKQLVTIMSGASLGHLLVVAVTPLLARLYTPENFGVYGIANSMALLITAIGCLRFDFAILLPKTDEKAAQLYTIATLTAIAAAAIALICISIVYLFSSFKLGSTAWVIPAIVLVGSAGTLHQLAVFTLIRHKMFAPISFSYLTRGVITAAFQVAAGLSAIGPLGLILGRGFGFIGAILICLPGLRKYIFYNLPPVRINKLKGIAKEYIDFPKYGATREIITACSSYAPTFVLAATFSGETVGAYTLAYLVVQAANALLSNSLRQVVARKCAEELNAGRSLKKILTKTTLPLVALGIPATILLAALAPTAFNIIFGENWHSSGVMASWMAFWALSYVIGAPAIATLETLQQQRQLLNWTILFLVVRLVVLSITAFYFDALVVVAVQSVTSIIWALNLIILAYRAASLKPSM